jgi:hypothetical protein
MSETGSIDRSRFIIDVIGGLGNQLFIIATGLAYCYRYDRELVIIPMIVDRASYWDSLLSQFKKYVQEKDDPLIPIYHEPTFSYREIPPDVQRASGYFQSSRYFSTIRDIMKQSLTFPKDLDKTILDKYGPILDSPQTVIVHARRGDYTHHPTVHNPLPDSYYITALEEMQQRVQDPFFVLLSDDMTYWKESTLFQDKPHVMFDESEIVCLYMMSQSRHFIMANSSFSWWGVFMATKADNVIAPRPWFGPAGPQDWQDLYEEGWILI